ncbi:MAG: hypothetical protein GWN18_07720, partial [Thermoplasmata archaeon]|nr:hypothetical protein [Thermoplasmata archaeon]NIS11951.1 hypothetical protein [Thermoplasmata archaeon]NIS19853.1 hypothetical protein [Thermoplasmata archaeon]NIT78978.1 hypothetical protein [Thermoplasmata archaeon]NIU48962.1 hypothetical protein [Thermoplasmata archaeon]
NDKDRWKKEGGGDATGLLSGDWCYVVGMLFFILVPILLIIGMHFS